MSWQSWLHKLTAWDTLLQIVFVVAMVIIAVVVLSLEDCGETGDRAMNVGSRELVEEAVLPG